MPTNILMPALSPTMTEGTLARWLKNEGDTVTAGDVIAEIETDKATMEVEAVDEGRLGKILVPAGTANVAVNAPIAILVDAGEAVPDVAAAAPPATPANQQAATATPAPPPAAAASTQTEAKPLTNGHDSTHRVFASPLARRIAAEAGVDLASLTGSGPNGRVVRADVERAKSTPAPKAPEPPKAEPPKGGPPKPATKPATPPPTQAPGIFAPHRLVPLTSMRRVVARRLTEAKQTVPHFYLSVDIQLDALLKLRTELNARSKKDAPGAFKLSVNDLLIKSAAVALREVPGVNASFTDVGIAYYDDVDISVAVAIPDGLITPIIRQADRKSPVAISNEMKDLAARAKAGKLKPDEYQGGGFSISNLGMFGISTFAAIINPPQGAILAVGAGEQRPVVRDGVLAVATMMTCTMSVDHRVVDGALGAQWLQAFKSIVEDPLGLLL
jgi:pyruvate dehydrogenase E2 component (dihydrolipoamide acetyltransferase)